MTFLLFLLFSFIVFSFIFIGRIDCRCLSDSSAHNLPYHLWDRCQNIVRWIKYKARRVLSFRDIMLLINLPERLSHDITGRNTPARSIIMLGRSRRRICQGLAIFNCIYNNCTTKEFVYLLTMFLWTRQYYKLPTINCYH